MYAKDDEFIKDFAARTKANYEALKRGSYEVTALINSAIGLLIIPRAKAFKKICDSMISTELLATLTSPNCLKVNTYSEPICLQEICRHMRNAIAHARIEFEAEKSPRKTDPIEIKKVIFKDCYGNQKFELQVSVDIFEQFLFAFSGAIAEAL